MTTDPQDKHGPPPKPFLHYCACGQWGLFGHGVNLREGKEGEWYCAEHNPKKTRILTDGQTAFMENNRSDLPE